MKPSIPFIATALFATSVLAADSSSSSRFERRRKDSREDCSKALADKYCGRAPRGMTATVCYTRWNEYTIADRSPEHYKYAEEESCSVRNPVAGWDVTTYDCFWLNGANTFEVKNDGGYVNLAINRDGEKCEWGDKILTCRA